MKKKIYRVLTCIVLINITVTFLFILPYGHSASDEITSKYGESPVIDGYIDLLAKEWNDASKSEISLGDFPMDIWVMQNDINLYISIQFELEFGYHSTNEFIGLIISNSSSEDIDEFIDAKIIQFTNISENEYSFFDYNVSGSVFLIDTEENGDGAAKLEGIISTYEFALPIKGDDANDDDAALDFGNSYAFNITYGDTPAYPSGIKKSAMILINIKSSSSSIPPIIDIVFYVLNIILFSVTGLLLGFYFFRISKLKEYTEKYKR